MHCKTTDYHIGRRWFFFNEFLVIDNWLVSLEVSSDNDFVQWAQR